MHGWEETKCEPWLDEWEELKCGWAEEHSVGGSMGVWVYSMLHGGEGTGGKV